MGLERVNPETVAPDQQIEATTSPTCRAPLVRRQKSPLSSEIVNPSEMDFKEPMDALTTAVMELKESRTEGLTIQCSMARLPILEDFVIDFGPALRVRRPALAIEERLESMEDLSDGGGRQRFPTDLLASTELGSPSSGAPPERGASIPPKGRALSQWQPPRSPGGAHQLKGSPNDRCQLNNGRRLRVHQRDHGNHVRPER